MKLYLALAAALASSATAALDWAAVTNRNHLQLGQQTFYGQDPDQDHQGACSLSENAGNFFSATANGWTHGNHVTVALNRNQLDGGKGCGMCIVFRGVPNSGLGMTPLPEGQWFRGIVNNECSDPGCDSGAIDLNINGDGKFKAEWYAIPCDFGTGPSKLQYSIVASNPYWFELVVANHAIPVESVSALIGGRWVNLPRSTANRFTYSGDSGEWNKAGPLKVRVTSVTGETVEDALPTLKGGMGTAQFTKFERPAALPPLATVWPGYGKPWAERVFKGVAAKGPVMPRPKASPDAAKVEKALQPNADREVEQVDEVEEIVADDDAAGAVSTEAATDEAEVSAAADDDQPATVVKAVSKLTQT